MLVGVEERRDAQIVAGSVDPIGGGDAGAIHRGAGEELAGRRHAVAHCLHRGRCRGEASGPKQPPTAARLEEVVALAGGGHRFDDGAGGQPAERVLPAARVALAGLAGEELGGVALAVVQRLQAYVQAARLLGLERRDLEPQRLEQPQRAAQPLDQPAMQAGAQRRLLGEPGERGVRVIGRGGPWDREPEQRPGSDAHSDAHSAAYPGKQARLRHDVYQARALPQASRITADPGRGSSGAPHCPRSCTDPPRR